MGPPYTHEDYRKAIKWKEATCYICGQASYAKLSGTLCEKHIHQWLSESKRRRPPGHTGWDADLFIQYWVLDHPELSEHRPELRAPRECGSCGGTALMEDYLCEECRSNLHPT